MPPRSGAGQLFERVAFDKRDIVDDGYGNPIAGDWREQFQQQAKFTQIRASETVMAGRLESRSVIIIEVRISADTKRIETDWQARDVRRGIAYNIREIHPPGASRASLEILAESNVNTG